MIQPWQVWLADLDPTEGHEQAGSRPVLVVSSLVHLQSMREGMMTIVPITSKDLPVRNRVQIINPKGQANWVITEQIRTIDTLRLPRSTPWWSLTGAEIDQVRRSLSFMVDF